MFYRLKWFFKNHLQRDSFIWNALVAARRWLYRLERLKWQVLSWTLPFRKIRNLNQFECKIYSQNGEDGLLQAIFQKIGVTNKFAVEFGVENGSECNTRYLVERKGWIALQMDPADHAPTSQIKKEFITAENINEVFKKHNVPASFDLLSIDIDGNDYWVWKALDPFYTPRVVVMEYNGKFPPTESKTIPYDPDFRWDGSDYYGASLGALSKLAGAKGYTLIGCDREGVNAFFVHNRELDSHFVRQDIHTLYRKPRFGKAEDQGGWPSGSKQMISV
jgi:hypothetical protein